MYLLGVDDDGELIVLGENELFTLWLYFYDLIARSVVEVVDETEETE